MVNMLVDKIHRKPNLSTRESLLNRVALGYENMQPLIFFKKSRYKVTTRSSCKFI